MLTTEAELASNVLVGARVRLASVSVSQWSGWPRDPLSPTQTARSAARGQRVRVAIVVAMGFVLFAGAGILAGLVIWREPTATDSAPVDRARSPLTTAHEATGRLDESTRQATVGPATMMLPDDPYVVEEDPKHVDGLIDVIFLANAPVHSDYHGQDDWLATVSLALLSPDVARSGLEAAGETAMRRFSQLFFANHATRLTGLATADRSVDGHPGLEFSADVHYVIEHLPSRYDHVVVRLVQADDGSIVAAISSIPNDASPHLADLAAQSLDSLQLK
jgi:hypothetical protein